MIHLRKSESRGHADHGWLLSKHSFSFASYYDPNFMGWGNLRVINEDQILPGKGFGTHGHRDMEIISYVLSGELAHKDDMGNVKGIPPGDIQRMSAGTGVMHSEFNHAPNSTTHFFQIWIQPNVVGIPPSYEQKTVSKQSKNGQLELIAGPVGGANAVKVHADAKMYVGEFKSGQNAQLNLDPNRKAYFHLIKGQLSVNGLNLNAGDALLFEQESQISMDHAQDAEVLVFDLCA